MLEKQKGQLGAVSGQERVHIETQGFQRRRLLVRRPTICEFCAHLTRFHLWIRPEKGEQSWGGLRDIAQKGPNLAGDEHLARA